MPRAVVCRSLGPIEGLRLEEVPSQPLTAGAARIRLHACGVNFPDILTVAGGYQHKPPLPFTPGVESAGVVVEAALDAGVAVGNRVITRQPTGGYADEIVLPSAQLLPLPQGLSFVEGACFTVAYHTAYHALAQRAGLRAGEVLLVHGAGGGVGLAAVEIGKLLGATVIAAASSEAKLAAARARGADHLVDYAREPFVEAVRRLTGGEGASVVFDPVGGDALLQSLRCVAWGGRLLVVGFAGGTIPALPANRILLKGCAVIGIRAGEAGRRDPALATANREALLALATAGRLRPHVSETFPLERFAEAMRRLADRQAIGRIVLTTGADAASTGEGVADQRGAETERREPQ